MKVSLLWLQVHNSFFNCEYFAIILCTYNTFRFNKQNLLFKINENNY